MSSQRRWGCSIDVTLPERALFVAAHGLFFLCALAGEAAAAPVQIDDAPSGRLVTMNDGTLLQKNGPNWILYTPGYPDLVAYNPFVLDDPRPMMIGLKAWRTDWAFRFKDSAETFGFAETGVALGAGATGTLRLIGMETVTVPAGSFKAAHLRRDDESNCADCPARFNAHHDIWFASGTGIVKYRLRVYAGQDLKGASDWDAVSVQ